MSKANDNFVIGMSADSISTYYTLGKRLGQPGQFGFARLVVEKETKDQYAVKVIDKNKFGSADDRSHHFSQLRNEIRIMSTMEHKNIIKFKEVFEDKDELQIVMECCTGGELFDRIKDQEDEHYTEAKAALILRQCLEGIQYLHKRGIAHCDLKPDNFLFLDESDSSLKIIDFGMSKHVKRRAFLTSFRGTPYYVAPEVIDHKYSIHCDMWSVGVIMFIMLFGYPPFHHDSDDQIFKLIKRGFCAEVKDSYGANFPKAIPCSENAKNLIAHLLDLDPAKRLTATEALEHPWFKKGGSSTVPMVASVVNGLKEFQMASKLKQYLLESMVNSLDQDEVIKLRKTFADIDTDKSGTITVKEFQEALLKENIQITEEQVKSLIDGADADHNHELSYEELVVAYLNRKLKLKEDRLYQLFRNLDVNSDGVLSPDELKTGIKKGMTKMSAEEEKEFDSNLDQAIEEVDLDHNGYVDYEEFVQMWMKSDIGKARESVHGDKSRKK